MAALANALSEERVRNDGVERTLIAHDASVFDGGVAGPVCFPVSTDEVQAITRIALEHGRAIVPRGAGTGLTGGAIPLGAPIVIVTTKMTEIFDVDVDNEIAWVQPGVVNLDLTRHLTEFGYHFAPDPSSQQVATIGGNVANNSGGPHCLAYGVTNVHIAALEVVLPNGEIAMLGGIDAEPVGYDLRGVMVGSEGTLGVVTKIAVRLTANPPQTRTMLVAFDTVRACAETVSSIISSGIVPAAMEVMDQRIVTAVENYVHAGYPTAAAAVLLIDLDGLADGVVINAEAIREIATDHQATSIRLATSDAERTRLWHGRKTAFGAMAQIAPDYYLHDTVVPRARLADVLDEVYRIADEHELIVMNVFHAGDGNLHPVLLFDARDIGVMDRVHAAGEAIIRASLNAGGVLSGEHGIGVEKQRFMELLFTHNDLDHQDRLRRGFDPNCRANPGKVMPVGHNCADIAALRATPTGVWG